MCKQFEYRLYYSTNAVTETMQPGDRLFLAMQRNSTMLAIVTSSETIENQLLWLFGIADQAELPLAYQAIGPNSAELDFTARYILEELGIEPEEPEAAQIDAIIEPFGLTFPRTDLFSQTARNSLPDISPLDDADSALLAWIEREEMMFRRLERRIVAQRIASGFAADGDADVDGFLAFSLSVQNRRKSRAGQALEHHLAAIFSAHSIRHERGVVTENRNKPDFLFPGQSAYSNPDFPAARLTMLGAKSTLKDRWRQVLSEAERIATKHLLTLEPGISENQTSEMQAKQLQLVLPRNLHQTFRAPQQAWLMNVAQFLDLVKSRES